MSTHQDTGPQRCSCLQCQNRRLALGATSPRSKHASRAPSIKRMAVEAKIIGFMRGYQTESMRPPTINEIMQHMGYQSPRAVSYHTERMIAEGKLIRRGNGTSRNLFVP